MLAARSPPLFSGVGAAVNWSSPLSGDVGEDALCVSAGFEATTSTGESLLSFAPFCSAVAAASSLLAAVVAAAPSKASEAAAKPQKKVEAKATAEIRNVPLPRAPGQVAGSKGGWLELGLKNSLPEGTKIFTDEQAEKLRSVRDFLKQRDKPSDGEKPLEAVTLHLSVVHDAKMPAVLAEPDIEKLRSLQSWISADPEAEMCAAFRSTWGS